MRNANNAAINLRAKLARFSDDTDETLVVLDGEMQIGFRDRSVTVRAGEMYVVPRGVEHITRAAQECSTLIIEPRGVVNTGASYGALTAPDDVWV